MPNERNAFLGIATDPERVCFRCGVFMYSTQASCSAVPVMSKQLVTFSFLCSFVLFLAPGPAHGNFNSGDCTIGDSPGRTVHVYMCEYISPTST